MEQSIIHIKAPHEVHIAAKVKAAQLRTSMNQYIVDLIAEDIGKEDLKIAGVGIRHARKTGNDLNKLDLAELKRDLAGVSVSGSVSESSSSTPNELGAEQQPAVIFPKPQKISGDRCPHGFNLKVSKCKYGCKK